MTKRIISNSVKCHKCDTVIWSSHVHDFKFCFCGNIAVDGGEEYIRRVGDVHGTNCTDLSMAMENDDLNKVVAAVKEMRETNRNDYGIALGVIRALRDLGYLDMTKLET